MKTTKSLFKLTLAAFVLVGMLACAKDDVAVNNSQLEVRGPSLDSELEEFNVQSDLTIIVSRQSTGFGGGQSFRLSGEGRGQSPEFGECETSLVLSVDGQTGYATGQIVYSFGDAEEKLTFALSGYLSRTPGSASSELVSRLLATGGIPTFTNSDRPYGRGTTTLLGDVYNLMQRMNMFDIAVRTNANIHL